MSQDQQATKKTRTVYAPQPEGVGAAPQLISIELADDEEVEWGWTHTADGKSVVTGYTIVKKYDITE